MKTEMKTEMKTHLGIDLVDGREYLVTIGAETKLLFYRSYSAGFYDSWQEYPMHKVGEATKIEKSPNYDSKILIDGTYGDPAVLYFDGYVSTKGGEYLRIKSVDIEDKSIECYGGNLGSGFDFSRVSSSSPNDEEAQKAYIDYFKYAIHKKGIRTGSVIKHPKTGDELTVVHIEEPNLVNEFDYIFYMDSGNPIPYSYDLEVVSTPLTREEEIEQIIDKNVKWDGLKNNKIDFVKEIIKYFEK